MVEEEKGRERKELSMPGAEESSRASLHVCAHDMWDGCDTDPFWHATLFWPGGAGESKPNRNLLQNPYIHVDQRVDF